MLEGTTSKVNEESVHVPSEQAETVDNKNSKIEQNDTLIFNHDTVAKAMGGATTVGAVMGGVVGAVIAPDLAQKGSDAVRNAIKQEGDKIAEKILQNTGLDKIPGGQFLVKNQVTDIAHSAGEVTYNNIKSEVTTRGAAAGGAAAGIATLVVMEGINVGSALYSNYVTPYFAARREEEEKKEEYRQLQSNSLNQEMDTTSEALTDDEFGEFVLVSQNNKP